MLLTPTSHPPGSNLQAAPELGTRTTVLSHSLSLTQTHTLVTLCQLIPIYDNSSLFHAYTDIAAVQIFILTM